MAISNASEVLQLSARGVGRYATEKLKGLLRTKYYTGQSLPALGLVLLDAADEFTAVSHTYTATLTPRVTADVPTPAAVFTDRAADFFTRAFDGSPVVAVELANADFATAGFYDLRIKAVTGGGAVNYLPEIEVEVIAAI
jgi:hypothetical protein